MTPAEAHVAVSLYRQRMSKVVKLWNVLQRKMHVAYATGKDFKLELPSGRSLDYGKVTTTLQQGRRNYVAMLTKGSKKIPMRLWGGLLAENFSQALAREIFADMMLRIEEAGMEIIFHVHDEFIIEVDEDNSEKTLEDVIESMSRAPDWIPDIPLAAEGKILSRYEK